MKITCQWINQRYSQTIWSKSLEFNSDAC